jgi:GC-rich sequence DNA-binding factor
MPYIDSLEKRMIELMRARRDRFTERRRQDVRDQMEEVSAAVSILGGNPVSVPPPSADPGRTRRAAEREGRRTRRRRLREKEMNDGRRSHKDGLSSDDEETDMEFNAFKTQIGKSG